MTNYFSPTPPLPLYLGTTAFADAGHAVKQTGAILSEADASKVASFDISGRTCPPQGQCCHLPHDHKRRRRGRCTRATGAVGGADVLSYVWPTSLNPSAVGFEGDTGILAMAATSHPDFDDTPLYDENNDGDPTNDGVVWHSHWVVLTPTEACGPGALAVRDIPEGETPQLPATWPGFPIFLDSPGFTPLFDGPEIAVNVGFRSDVELEGVAYDGVTSALRVNANYPLAAVVRRRCV